MDKFFSEIQKKPRSQAEDTSFETSEKAPSNKALPKGVVLGKDGKPCRSCTSSAAWTAMMKQQTSRPSPSPPSSSSNTPSSSGSSTSSPLSTPSSSPPTLSSSSSSSSSPLQPCPPNIESLGSSTWTFLHTLSAAYPPKPTPPQQSEMKQFLTLFSKLYPCWHCAEDFQAWMARKENAPELGGRQGLMRWMCEAHNEVNGKLGKGRFDCSVGSLEERWGKGPGDGRCG